MKEVFADACYWIALLNRADALHQAALSVGPSLTNVRLITTDEVLTEVLNYFSKRGSLRTFAAEMAIAIYNDPHVLVLEQSRASFDGGLHLYRQHRDKRYSLTDCISFTVMRERGIVEALSDDQHFVQAGFAALLRNTA